ncbi:hypothetical protein PF008_g17747 [Phytophthora fragariae]|uniref:Uncharacterized protein n=1 Tax=Phytophthora fragariae TaxID=53985 RepID=A0A6G0R7C4_9STRA|nr:hypothetical protein PF008_g17747 [Phytophthora fragariae]
MDTPLQAEMRKLALAPSEVHGHGALRPLQDQETAVLLAYLDKSLELPHAPNFLKATLPLIQRAMVEQFHESHLEVTLTADVSPSVKLRRNMTHNTLLAQLYETNADSPRGRQMIDHIMDDVKLLRFDGIHTLRFTFNSRRVASLYAGLAFRLRGTCIELEDSELSHREGTFRAARIRRQYAVRVYGADSLGLVVLLTAIGNLPGVNVVDAERPRMDSQSTVDNRFLLLRFSTDECPEALRGVTKITIHGQMVTLHHYLVQTRLPCGRCFAPFHTTGFCRAHPGHLDRLHAKYKIEYTGPLPAYTVGEAVQYRHSDGDSLAAFLTQLQQDLTSSLADSTNVSVTSRVASLATTEGVDPLHSLRQQPQEQDTGAGQSQEETVTAPVEEQASADVEEGFIVVTRRPGKTKRGGTPPTAYHDNESLEQKSSRGVTAEPSNSVTQRQGPKATSAEQGTGHSKTQRPGGRKNKRVPGRVPKAFSKIPGFAQFKHARELGRFAALEDPEEIDNDTGSDTGPDEAPYGYPSAPNVDRAAASATASGGRSAQTPHKMSVDMHQPDILALSPLTSHGGPHSEQGKQQRTSQSQSHGG